VAGSVWARAVNRPDIATTQASNSRLRERCEDRIGSTLGGFAAF
jgi:hypothetical protein